MQHEETPEYGKTERPLLQQLSGMGWHVEKGSVHVADETGRDSFQEVILEDRLRSALRRINDNEDGAWMDDARIDQAVTTIERTRGQGRMQTNREIDRLLREGISVDAPEGHWSDTKKAKVIDFENPDDNEFVAISQFRVDRPGTTRYVVPDVVLFVNGLPLVVIECKSPYADKAIEAAIQDLFTYSNQRDDLSQQRGSDRLFDFNLAMVGTCYEQARMGAFGAPAAEFVPWNDTSPVPTSQVANALDKQGQSLSQQETLAAGMLRPSHLIDLLADFVVYEEEGGINKVVGRYQQFRTVQKAIDRLKTGETKIEHGLEDQRGGIVWHTQGAGKSLTMVFLVRRMRRDDDLRSFKAVGVTDRTSLEHQLSGTAELAGEPVRIAESTAQLKSLLSEDGADLVFAMIQKFQDPETGEVEMEETFDELNDSEDIVVLVDEAHRTHTNTLHQNLRYALPNAARIGFTGTPIIDEAKKLTTEIFGEYVDTYKMDDAEADGVILPIRYEGKTTLGEVGMPSLLDAQFEDVFGDRSKEEMQRIQKKYATRGDVLEAEKLIEKKAHNMLRHYVETVLPGGCKAQVVATSRRAAVRYQEKLVEAKEQLLEDLETLPPAAERMSEADLDDTDRETQFLVRASEHLDTIRRLDFAAVISEGDDPDSWRQWTRESNQETHKSRFKKPLVADNDANQDGLCMLVVHGMLTTGFNAPVNQAMYLDRRLTGHNLLQAIARVNRRYPGKTHGLVVDYCGVAAHLADALHEYNQEDVKQAMVDLEEELPKLDERHQHVVDFFEREGISIDDEEACVDLLRDEKKRAQFSTRLRKFLRSYDTIMPRPQAAEYRADVKRFGRINRRAANRYYDDELNILDAGPKVRRLIDEHVEAEGIETSIEPTTITEPEFDYLVGNEPSDRAQAARMEHAVRHHVREKYNEDPVFYKDLSERVQNILDEHQDDWERQRELFRELIDDIRERTEDDAYFSNGDRPIAPFARIIADAIAPDDETLNDDQRELVTDLTVDVVDHIAQEIDRPDFWRTDHLRSQLRSWVIQRLDAADVIPYSEVKRIADDVMQTAEANHEKLTA